MTARHEPTEPDATTMQTDALRWSAHRRARRPRTTHAARPLLVAGVLLAAGTTLLTGCGAETADAAEPATAEAETVRLSLRYAPPIGHAFVYTAKERIALTMDNGVNVVQIVETDYRFDVLGGEGEHGGIPMQFTVVDGRGELRSGGAVTNAYEAFDRDRGRYFPYHAILNRPLAFELMPDGSIVTDRSLHVPLPTKQTSASPRDVIAQALMSLPGGTVVSGDRWDQAEPLRSGFSIPLDVTWVLDSRWGELATLRATGELEPSAAGRFADGAEVTVSVDGRAVIDPVTGFHRSRSATMVVASRVTGESGVLHSERRYELEIEAIGWGVPSS